MTTSIDTTASSLAREGGASLSVQFTPPACLQLSPSHNSEKEREREREGYKSRHPSTLSFALSLAVSIWKSNKLRQLDYTISERLKRSQSSAQSINGRALDADNHCHMQPESHKSLSSITLVSLIIHGIISIMREIMMM